MYFSGNMKLSIGSASFSPYDFVFFGIGFVSMCLFAINVFNVARKLRLEDTIHKQPGRF
jgi:hypothetical protein